MSDKPITPEQAAHWWKAVAAQFAVIANEADKYLLTGQNETILDREAIDEINAAMVAARTAADTAFGAHFRAAQPQIEKAQRDANAYQQPAGQPTYAGVSWAAR